MAVGTDVVRGRHAPPEGGRVWDNTFSMTQAVHMALHDRGVATTLSNLPLSPGQWLTSGLIMPAVQFEVEDEGLQRSNTTLQVSPVGGGAHILGSAAIYSELNRRYPLGSSSGSGGSSTGSSSSTSTAQGSRADYSALLAVQEEL